MTESLRDRDESKDPGDAPNVKPLHADRLTWAVLLGRWVEFARSAVALPTEGEGAKLRDSVADIIMLQAVWFALQHLQELSGPERALGIARAEVLIERHEAALRARWRTAMPPKLDELVDDAREQLRAAQGASDI